MSEPLRLSVLTPEGSVFAAQVRSLVLPGVDGYFGVLRGHAPLVAALGLGILRAETYEDTHFFVLTDGFLDVRGAEAVVLADRVQVARTLDDAKGMLQSLRLQEQETAGGAAASPATNKET